MSVYELIAKKRDRKLLTEDEIISLVDGYTSGEIPDYQMAALNMAIYLNGMSPEEIAAYTRAMVNSGDRVHFSSDQFYVDKHSTGGVGDKVSLVLAPIVASLGIKVPMIAGRGLGHTGGTLDKLEAISGFNVNLSLDQFKAQVESLGTCIIGQTAEIAPADKKLYALRDVTATVSSIPLITGSIMSKKIAEGINGLVMDLKWGNGAFMKTEDEAINLAQSLARNGEANGVHTVAYLTNMSQPLGQKIGNWLEIEEVLDCLQGHGPSDLMRVTHLLCGEMIRMAGKAERLEDAIAISIQQIENGEALALFRQIVSAQGGDLAALDAPNASMQAPVLRDVFAPKSGVITKIDTLEIGLLSVAIGGGRAKTSDEIDHRVGIDFNVSLGDTIAEGQKIATLHLASESDAASAERRLVDAVEISQNGATIEPLISKKVTAEAISSAEEIDAYLANLIV